MFLQVAIGIVLYVAGAAFSAGYFLNLMNEQEGQPEFTIFVAAILWPIVLPINLFFRLGKIIKVLFIWMGK